VGWVGEQPNRADVSHPSRVKKKKKKMGRSVNTMRCARRRNHKAAICDETNNGMFSAKEEKGGERGRDGE
jgi:hypothetical protein